MPAHAARRPRSVLTVLSLVLLTTFVTGCSRADRQGGAAAGALRDFRTSLDRFDERVDASVRAIERLQSSGTYDVQQAYADFLTEYYNVVADATTVNERAEVMRDTGADYYIAARKEAEADGDAQAAETLAQRQQATRAAYDVLQQRLGTLREAYRVYRNQLTALNRHLNRDVSRQRVASASQQMMDAREQAQRVKASLGEVKAQTDALAKAGTPRK